MNTDTIVGGIVETLLPLHDGVAKALLPRDAT
jgi:hypothetical protein